MVLFASEPTLLEILASYIYRYVIMATLICIAFLYYLFRTKAPLKEDNKQSSEEIIDIEFTRYRTTNGAMANGNLEIRESEEEEGSESHPRRRNVISEVTVRKIFLPAEATYTDMESAARKLISNGEAPHRKNSDTGGPDFRAAIRNIREASKRLEEDDVSPVPYSSF